MEKKLTVLVILTAILEGCSATSGVQTDPLERGWVDRSVLEHPSYREFQAAYDTVRIAPGFADMIREQSQGIEVTIFFGGWCSDSKREVPRFLRLADEAEVPRECIRLYALDRTKKSADGLTDRYRIELVPTFVIFRNGEEIGRITESPRTTMEADVLSILAQGASR